MEAVAVGWFSGAEVVIGAGTSGNLSGAVSTEGVGR